ncbi:hypothetical protein AB0D08_19695 [Kitasatospora sp. NPDC048540]|uniref:hypothetical protein n=1 Tax=unclassified Kitasatospora TaxID=2633591 RepID=UPI00053A645F|nr:hypothetical protein [Kitasatospora sp. MBT63]
MPITDDIKKTLSDPTPLYALAGVGDLAYEKLREVPGKVEELTADRKATQEKAAARFQEAQAALVGAQAKVTETVNTLPTDLKELQEKAQTFALQQVGRAAELAVKAMEAYEELAVRGKAVVDKGRGGSAEAGSAAAEQPAEVTEVVVDFEARSAAGEPVEGELVDDAPAPKKTTRARKADTEK